MSTTCDSEILSVVQPKITQEMNSSLLRPIEFNEVKAALFSMSPDKAPGPDGQNFWSLLGHDLAAFVSTCFMDCGFPVGTNDINVVLIPKKKVPERVSDLRPIAQCNVMYKVLAIKC